MRSSRTIGEVAEICGVAVHLLRQWEDAGLLAPERVHGQRRYNELDVRLVKFIRLGRELGLGLSELREVFAIRSVEERTEVLQRRKAQLEQHIALTVRQLEMVEHGLSCPYPDYRTCPELAAITEKALAEGVLSEAVLAPETLSARTLGAQTLGAQTVGAQNALGA